MLVAQRVNLSPSKASPAEGAGTVLGVDALLASPDRYLGRPVTVSGGVTRVIGPADVVLEDRLLVAADDPPADLRSGDTLRVTKPFSRFGMQQFERNLGVDLGDRAFAEFRVQPAIAADEVVTPEPNCGPGRAAARRSIGGGEYLRRPRVFAVLAPPLPRVQRPSIAGDQTPTKRRRLLTGGIRDGVDTTAGWGAGRTASGL